MKNYLKQSFPKSATAAEKIRRLTEIIGPDDMLAILIQADPDAIGSALALKRLFWRKARKILIYHLNPIQRADNLALIKLLRIDMQPVRHLKPALVTKWAVVDSQPGHYPDFRDIPFDIVIDHHPCHEELQARFFDVRENLGATATIMTEYLKGAKISPSQKLATALFYGIKTDTDNFVRGAVFEDISAFWYLYQFINMNIVKKIESSEMTRKTLASYRLAMERLTFLKDIAYVHLGEVENPDVLVIIADFFIRLAEATWSIVSGVHKDKLIVIFRNAELRGNAGKTAQGLFGRWGALAGGHHGAARAEMPLSLLPKDPKGLIDPGVFVLRNLKEMKKRPSKGAWTPKEFE
ncbi:MAG: DHH family phosphoesterase [Deltaproteobacteria bacterium]|nr:DHH family phosphoesterase [Deltaproteobacteria bacterium]